MQDAARGYVGLMQSRNSISHTIGGTTVGQRLASAGYTNELPTSDILGGYLPGAENNSFTATSESFDTPRYSGDIRAEAVAVMHHNLFTDASSASRGHRITMMAADWQEAGFALSFGSDGSFASCYGNHTFGHQAARGPFITGVAFADADGDGFYTPAAGEALGGLEVTVYLSGTLDVVASTTTFGSGGFGAAVPEGGAYDVRFVGTGIDQTYSDITVGTQNVKVDAVDPGFEPRVSPVEILLSISSIAVGGSDVVITWYSEPGAAYRVLASTDLVDWDVIVGSETTGATGSAFSHYTHVGGATPPGRRYYKVERY